MLSNTSINEIRRANAINLKYGDIAFVCTKDLCQNKMFICVKPSMCIINVWDLREEERTWFWHNVDTHRETVQTWNTIFESVFIG